MTRQTPAKVRVLIVPKFEIDEMSGDFPGEAQLFYEKYCPGEHPMDIKHLPETAQFYLNEKSGVAILITGSGCPRRTAEGYPEPPGNGAVLFQ